MNFGQGSEFWAKEPILFQGGNLVPGGEFCSGREFSVGRCPPRAVPAVPRASGRRMCRAVRDFLFAQKVQAPLEVYSEWLSVGHVDEFLTFVPALDRKVPTLEPPWGSSQHPKILLFRIFVLPGALGDGATLGWPRG